MSEFNPREEIPPRILASDLDGTLIPLPGQADNRVALERLRQVRGVGAIGLVFATGRHFESVLEVMASESLPEPDWIVCDVGTSIYHLDGAGEFQPFQPYALHLQELIGNAGRESVEELLRGVTGITLQPAANQREFKISYLAQGDAVDGLAAEINGLLDRRQLAYTCMASVDPFTGNGLLDVLPQGVSKAYALIWLATHADFDPSEVIYAGDSGNDLAALICGFRAIVVANAGNGLAEKVRQSLAGRALQHRIFTASSTATSGVLEGCRYFGLPGTDA